MLDPDGSPEWQSTIHHFYPHLLRVNLVLKVILKRFTWNANFQWHERRHEVSTLGDALFRRTQMSTTRSWWYYVSDECSLENWLEVLERRIWCLHLDVRSICWSASPSNERWTHTQWSCQDCLHIWKISKRMFKTLQKGRHGRSEGKSLHRGMSLIQKMKSLVEKKLRSWKTNNIQQRK